jgi:hypothetical protein
MKKICFAIITGAIIVGPAFAYADTTSNANGNPGQVMQAWGLTGDQSAKIGPGASATDAAGFTITCPIWSYSGCYDLTKTDWYSHYMTNLGQTLKASGVAGQFPEFAYWTR